MRVHSTIAIATAILSTSADAIQLSKRAEGPSRVVALPIQRRHTPDPLYRDRARRKRDTQQVTLDNLETLYYANGSLGTPAQSLRLHLDTGSSDLWVNTPNSALCSDSRAPCAYAGTYSANDSSTYEFIASDFNISYVDGSGASGDYVSDTFTIGDTTLDRLQFGIGYDSSAFEGILGIGYAINEVQVNRAGKQAYQNLPAKMVAEKLISSNAYSIWLNDLDASTGSILFGGVDTEQFSGILQTLPIQKTQGSYSEFLITLTELSFGGSTIAKGQKQAVLLDTGSSLTYLPDAMAAKVYDVVGATTVKDDTGAVASAYLPCSYRTNSSTLDFTFSGPTITVDMTELLIEVGDSRGRQLTFDDGTPACLFGISSAGTGTAVLGDTFLRSAYVVYDMSNNEISIAQTVFNATTTNVQEISTGTSSVPDATAVANPVEASNVAGGGGRIGGTATLGLGDATAVPKSAAGKSVALGSSAVIIFGAMMVFASL